MHLVRFVLSVLLLTAMPAVAADVADMKSDVITSASGPDGDGRVLDSIAIGDVGAGLAVAAHAYSANKSDVVSARDMDAWIKTIYCIAGGVRANYGDAADLPSDMLAELRNEYADLLTRTRANADALGIVGPGKEFDFSDERELYSDVITVSREAVFDTAQMRVASNSDADDIETGLAVALGGVMTGIVRNAGIDLGAASSDRASQTHGNNGASATITPSTTISAPATDANSDFVGPQDSVQTDTTMESADDTDEIDELCAEFPDEPECAE